MGGESQEPNRSDSHSGARAADDEPRLDKAGLDEPGLVDIHCHCLPGLDDGPRELGESIDLCKALIDDGFSTVIATPHQMGRYEGVNTRERVLASLDSLTQELAAEQLPLRVLPGADVRIHDRLPSLVKAGEALTVGDKKQYLLLELPHDFYVDPSHLFATLAQEGTSTVLTHPERYRYLRAALEPVDAWRALGAVIQVTAGSLLGDFGRTAYGYAWRIVHAGLADVVATDAHDAVRRRPCMQAAIQRLEFEVGAAETNRLCRDNPRRILRGDPILTTSGAAK